MKLTPGECIAFVRFVELANRRYEQSFDRPSRNSIASLHEQEYRRAQISTIMEISRESLTTWAQFITPEKFAWAQGHDLRVTLGSLGDDLNVCLSEYPRETEEMTAVTPQAKELFDAIDESIRQAELDGPTVDQLAQGFYQMIGQLRVMHRGDSEFSVDYLERTVQALVRATRREERSKVENTAKRQPTLASSLFGDRAVKEILDIWSRGEQYLSRDEESPKATRAQQKEPCQTPKGYLEVTSDFISQEEVRAAWDDYKLGVTPGQVDDQDAYRNAISSGVLIGLGGESTDANEEMATKWANEIDSDPSAPSEVIRITDDGYTVEYNGSTLTAEDAVIIDWDSGFPRVTLTLVADKIIIE